MKQQAVNEVKEQNPNQWLTLKEAAEEIGISVGTLRRRCTNDEIPHSRVIRGILIKRNDLLEYIERFRVEAVKQPTTRKKIV